MERAFEILQAQFAIVRGPARFWDQEILWYIMTACVIMHNMIIENERGQALDYSFYELMGRPVRVQRNEDQVERFLFEWSAFLRPTRTFVMRIAMSIFKTISSRSGGHGSANKTTSLYFICLMLYVSLCVDLCAT